MDLIANRTFLLKQVDVEGGKKKDVVAKKGELVKGVTEREAIKFWDSFEIKDDQKKKLLIISKNNGYTRI